MELSEIVTVKQAMKILEHESKSSRNNSRNNTELLIKGNRKQLLPFMAAQIRNPIDPKITITFEEE